MGKLLIIIGIILILAGLLIEYGGKIPYFGKLPGDIKIQRDNYRLYFPLTSSLIISLLLSLIFLFIRWLRY